MEFNTSDFARAGGVDSGSFPCPCPLDPLQRPATTGPCERCRGRGGAGYWTPRAPGAVGLERMGSAAPKPPRCGLVHGPALPAGPEAAADLLKALQGLLGAAGGPRSRGKRLHVHKRGSTEDLSGCSAHRGRESGSGGRGRKVARGLVPSPVLPVQDTVQRFSDSFFG